MAWMTVRRDGTLHIPSQQILNTYQKKTGSRWGAQLLLCTPLLSDIAFGVLVYKIQGQEEQLNDIDARVVHFLRLVGLCDDYILGAIFQYALLMPFSKTEAGDYLILAILGLKVCAAVYYRFKFSNKIMSLNPHLNEK